MASLAGQNFDGSTGFTDSHDTIPNKVGNVSGSMISHLVAKNVSLRFGYGHAIRWNSVAQLPASMLCIEAVN